MSAIYVNNEVGTINDIEEITKIAHLHGAALHTDVTQALGKMYIDVKALNCGNYSEPPLFKDEIRVT